ncbi:uncharacterized protein LOC127882154 isoform X2 [Dreissena polymorpha]|uniref:uncharacterized protein LOC127882154 isoform X2 n=1 Tax=Dreissena polymorpha TaxID=45954 RepID=UPI00226412EA|nr:uncharacterized protein LOC127882154 isoform X2 [Dreissena polymorpha]
MSKSYISVTILLISMVVAIATAASFLSQPQDGRDKRQIGDLRAAEYLARITLDKNKMLRYLLQSPLHCTELACGLVDVFESMEKRTMSDQRLAELQALIALSKGHGIPIAHGQIDPWRIGKRRKRSLDMVFNGLSDNQKYRLFDILMGRSDEQFQL